MTCGGTKPDEIGRRTGRSGKTVRAWLRSRWPEHAPGQGGEWRLEHAQVVGALLHFDGHLTTRDRGPHPESNSPPGSLRARSDSDEAYVVGLAAEILNEEPLRQHRFDWLRGDTGVGLPVDAYFPTAQTVLEYREMQHVIDRGDSFRFWDAKMTASGTSRRVQRKLYDELREGEIPRHGLNLVVVHVGDFARDVRGRLRRLANEDRAVLRKALRGKPIADTKA